MPIGVSLSVTMSDIDRVRDLVKDRNAPQKHVWRAEIVLLSAEGMGTNAIMREIGKSKTCVWRWQERFATEGVDGLLHDKTRPSRIAKLDARPRARTGSRATVQDVQRPRVCRQIARCSRALCGLPAHAVVLSVDEKIMPFSKFTSMNSRPSVAAARGSGARPSAAPQKGPNRSLIFTPPSQQPRASLRPGVLAPVGPTELGSAIGHVRKLWRISDGRLRIAHLGRTRQTTS